MKKGFKRSKNCEHIIILAGDPLYVNGGIPKCCAPETVDETFAEDG